MLIDDIPVVRMEDRVGFKYVEKASLYVKNNSLFMAYKRGKPEAVCLSNITCLLLGAGTSISRDAIRMLSEHNTTVLWCGKRGLSMYTVGLNTNQSMKNAKEQIERISTRRISMWKKLLFERKISYRDTDNVKELLLIEATYMRRLYKEMADKYGLEWTGRIPKISEMDPNDKLNYSITICNMALYGIATACISGLGYLPQFGIIHGYGATPLSYDLADVVKPETSIPYAMQYVTSHNDVDINELLCGFSQLVNSLNIPARMIKILETVFQRNL